MYDWEIKQYVADKKVLTASEFYNTNLPITDKLKGVLN